MNNRVTNETNGINVSDKNKGTDENAASIIDLKGLTKEFGAGNNPFRALDEVDLSIKKGEIFGIIGMSGAGKSTLVRCINLLERPTTGSVIFDGRDLTVLTPSELNKSRRSMGMIFQQFNLLMQRNVLRNVCFPLEIAGVSRKEAEARAGELLELVDLGEKKEAYPSQLSGGQKQRVAIARALATDPRVLLCDEATSALDPKTTESILRLLKEINRKLDITIIVITHEMRVVQQICDRVAIIDGGKIAEIGDVVDIFSNPKTAAAKLLVYPERGVKNPPPGACGKAAVQKSASPRSVRIVFDGLSSYEPVISNMTLACQAPVNIMFADTQDIGGNAVGQMIVQLPEDPAQVASIMDYLAEHDVNFEEVDEIG